MERWRAESEVAEIGMNTLESETHFCTSPPPSTQHNKEGYTVYSNDNFPSNVLRGLNNFRKLVVSLCHFTVIANFCSTDIFTAPSKLANPGGNRF